MILLVFVAFLVSAVSNHSLDNKLDADVVSAMLDVIRWLDRSERPTVTCGARNLVPSGDSSQMTPNLNNSALAKSLLDKIVGGNATGHGEIPWQARVTFYGFDEPTDYDCGAVIINEFWLVSAAHCFYQMFEAERSIIVGKHHLHHNDPEEQHYRVDRIFMNENYTEAAKDYDIALIKIQASRHGRGIQFNDFVQPICLPQPNMYLSEGTKLTVSGWGWTRPCVSCDEGSDDYSDKLMKAEIPIIGQEKCNDIYKHRMTDRMFCAGYMTGGVDTCKGDSGGPVVYEDEGYYMLYGIVSWGSGCAQTNRPGVYTRVPAVRNWIDYIIATNSPKYHQRIIPSKPD